MPKRVDHLISVILADQPDTHVVFSAAITPDSYVLNVVDEQTTLYVHPSHQPAVSEHATWGQSHSRSTEGPTFPPDEGSSAPVLRPALMTKTTIDPL